MTDTREYKVISPRGNLQRIRVRIPTKDEIQRILHPPSLPVEAKNTVVDIAENFSESFNWIARNVRVVGVLMTILLSIIIPVMCASWLSEMNKIIMSGVITYFVSAMIALIIVITTSSDFSKFVVNFSVVGILEPIAPAIMSAFVSWVVGSVPAIVMSCLLSVGLSYTTTQQLKNYSKYASGEMRYDAKNDPQLVVIIIMVVIVILAQIGGLVKKFDEKRQQERASTKQAQVISPKSQSKKEQPVVRTIKTDNKRETKEATTIKPISEPVSENVVKSESVSSPQVIQSRNAVPVINASAGSYQEATSVKRIKEPGKKKVVQKPTRNTSTPKPKTQKEKDAPGRIEYKQGVEYYRKLVRRYPKSAEAWYHLGASLTNYLTDMTHAKEAIEALDRATDLRPDYIEAWGQKGFTYGKMGNEIMKKECLIRRGHKGKLK